MKDNSYNPIPEFSAMMESVGLSIYSDEFAAEMMAWFHCFGGNNEKVVLNPGLNGAIRACADKMNIKGGEIPNPELFLIWKDKVRELAMAVRENSGFPDWLVRICERYDLKLPREGIEFMQDDIKLWIAAPESRIK